MSAVPATDRKAEEISASAHDVAFGANSTRLYPLRVIVCGLGRTGTTSKLDQIVSHA